MYLVKSGSQGHIWKVDKTVQKWDNFQKHNQEGDQGGPWTKLYLRSNNWFKKEENAWLCLHNASLEGLELFGNFSSIAPMIISMGGHRV